jgi:hypothetical protein
LKYLAVPPGLKIQVPTSTKSNLSGSEKYYQGIRKVPNLPATASFIRVISAMHRRRRQAHTQQRKTNARCRGTRTKFSASAGTRTKFRSAIIQIQISATTDVSQLPRPNYKAVLHPMATNGNGTPPRAWPAGKLLTIPTYTTSLATVYGLTRYS